MTHFKIKTVQGTHTGAAQPFSYPGGELHLKSLSSVQGGTWIADVRGAKTEDLAYAHLFADVAHQRQRPFVLMIPYLPAARSDRGEPTGAAVYASMIRAMNPQQVIGLDPHSTQIVRQINRGAPEHQGILTALDPTPLIHRALNDDGHLRAYNGVIAPDKGAVPRAAAAASALRLDLYTADKKRDFETGRIESVTLDQKLPDSGRYLVVDDICDGGGTFNLLAKAVGLDKQQLGLWVTHGIFSGRAEQLREYYGHIYTTDSHPGHYNSKVGASAVPTLAYMMQNLKEFD